MECVFFEQWHWRPADLAPLGYREVYSLYEEALRQKGAELSWQLRVASFPHMKRAGQRELANYAKRLSVFTLAPLTSVYDQVDDKTRALMIGDAVNISGDQWLESHAGQRDWLQQQNLSVAECVRRSQEHDARAGAFSGFTPSRRSRLKAPRNEDH